MGPTAEPRLLNSPTIHGNTIVFSYASDLWVASTEPGSIARQLTTSPGIETQPRISPDGSMIAFSASYDGNPDVYVIPIEGGEPTRLTFEPEPDMVTNWTPDGRIMYASGAGQATGRDMRLQIISPRGGLPTRTAIDQYRTGSMGADNSTVYYQRVNSNDFNWRKYRGGTQGRISIYNLATNTYSEVPAKREQNYFPMAVGKSVYFISDRDNGTLNLYRYDTDSKSTTRLTNFDDADIKQPSTDGKSIVYLRDGFLWKYDIATKAISKLTPRIYTDSVRARPALRNLAANITDFSLSPSGARIAVEARGELFNVPTSDGDTRNLTQTQGARERFPIWLGDGKTIAYISDASGEYDLYVRPSKGGEATKVTNGNLVRSITGITASKDGKKIIVNSRSGVFNIVDIASKTVKSVDPKVQGGEPSWSPDGKYIAYIAGTNSDNSKICFYDVAADKSIDITDGFYADVAVSFDLTGKYLYFISSRTFNQEPDTEGGISLFVKNGQRVYVLPLEKGAGNPLLSGNDEEGEEGAPPKQGPVTVDFDNIAKRAIPLPWEAGNYGAVIGARNGVFTVNERGWQKFDLNAKQAFPLFPPVPISFNANMTKFAYSMGGGRIGVLDARPGGQPGQGLLDLSAVEAVIDPRQEWKQIFWEGWRWYRDNYYDPNMRGLDWKALGKRYESYLSEVNSRADLNTVLGLMIGELGTGHSYVGGGDNGQGNRPVPTGLLGADYVAVGGKVQFKKIYRGFNDDEDRRGPLGEPGMEVREGEYLLAIDGQSVDELHSPSSRLQGKVNRYVTITVNSTPTMAGARQIRVRPLASEGGLRYAEWVESRRQMVNKLSGGRIGYLHVPNTSGEGAEGFARGYNGQTDKEALIVDERDNGGGNLPWFFVEKLARTSRTKVQSRNARDSMNSPIIDGPKVMLINENAGSGGDMLPYLFREAKLGPLIGKRTWGGLVGIGGSAPLVDGGFLTAPEFSIYDPKINEIVAENTGVDPDIDIDNRPDLVAQGRDPQLERAVEYLLDQLKKLPAKKPRTTIPTVGKNGRIGGK